MIGLYNDTNRSVVTNILEKNHGNLTEKSNPGESKKKNTIILLIMIYMKARKKKPKRCSVFSGRGCRNENAFRSTTYFGTATRTYVKSRLLCDPPRLVCAFFVKSL